MKKYISLTTALLVSAALVAACEDDSASDKGNNGDVCNSSTECQSNYCNDSHVCADKPLANLEIGSTCESHKQCKTGYCDENYKCAEKPGTVTKKGAIGDDCTADGDCESNHCVAKKCAEAETKKGAIGDVCAAHTDCESNNCVAERCAAASSEEGTGVEGSSCTTTGNCAHDLYCVNSTCSSLKTIALSECSSNSASFCAGNNAVKCGIYSEMTYRYYIDTCAEGSKCINMNQIAECAEKCTEQEENQVSTKCDPDQKTWDGYSNGVILFTCTKVDGDYYRVATSYTVCNLNDICLFDNIGCQ